MQENSPSAGRTLDPDHNEFCARNYAPLPVTLVRGEGVHVWTSSVRRCEGARTSHHAERRRVPARPMQGEAGIRIPPEGYLARCAEICRSHNVLLLADEVQTGLARLVMTS